MAEKGICPVCNGSGRVPYTGDIRHAKWRAGYNETDNTLACTNCGGQTMSVHGTGKVNLRPDGTPCVHEYVGETVGRCYHRYVCKHCGDVYYIDSGD